MTHILTLVVTIRTPSVRMTDTGVPIGSQPIAEPRYSVATVSFLSRSPSPPLSLTPYLISGEPSFLRGPQGPLHSPQRHTVSGGGREASKEVPLVTVRVGELGARFWVRVSHMM